MTLTFDAGVVAGLTLSAAIAIGAPLAAMYVLVKRFNAPLAAFGWGALTFFVSQFIARLPWQLPLNAYLAKHYGADEVVMAAWLATSALTAGIFEEGGRALAYRFVWKQRTTLGGAALGVGHGGLESVLLIGLSIASSLVIYVALANGLTLGFTPEVLAKLDAQFSKLDFWTSLLGGVERVAAMMLHTGCSLLVLEFARGRGVKWLLLSIVTHASLNGLVLLLVKQAGAWPAELTLLTLSGAILALALRHSLRAGAPR